MARRTSTVKYVIINTNSRGELTKLLKRLFLEKQRRKMEEHIR